MATAGYNGFAFVDNWVFFGFNTDNNVGVYLVMPQDGTITAVNFNCAALAGSGSGMVANGCIWDTNGNLLGNGAQVSLPYRAAGPGPYAWQTSGGMGLVVSGGTLILIGWWRSPQSGAGDNLWGFGNGNTEFRGTTANSVAPGAFSADASSGRQIGAYITYTPSGTPPPTPGPPPATALPIPPMESLYEQRRRRMLP